MFFINCFNKSIWKNPLNVIKYVKSIFTAMDWRPVQCVSCQVTAGDGHQQKHSRTNICKLYMMRTLFLLIMFHCIIFYLFVFIFSEYIKKVFHLIVLCISATAIFAGWKMGVKPVKKLLYCQFTNIRVFVCVQHWFDGSNHWVFSATQCHLVATLIHNTFPLLLWAKLQFDSNIMEIREILLWQTDLPVVWTADFHIYCMSNALKQEMSV